MRETALFDGLLEQPQFRDLAETIAAQNASVDPLLGMAARVVPQEQPTVDDDDPPGYTNYYQPPRYPSDEGGLRVPQYIGQAPVRARDRFSDNATYTMPTDRQGRNPLDQRFRSDTDTLTRLLVGLHHLGTQQPVEEPVRESVYVPEPYAYPAPVVPVVPGRPGAESRQRIHPPTGSRHAWVEPGPWHTAEPSVGIATVRAYGTARAVGENITDTLVHQAIPDDAEEANTESNIDLEDQELIRRFNSFMGIEHEGINEPDGYRGRRRITAERSIREASGRLLRRLGTLAAASSVAFAAVDALVTRISQH